MSTRNEESRFTDPDTAVDHIRRVARETAEQSGYRAAAFAVMELRREYRIMPLKQREAPADRLATWQAVRMETRSLVPMAMGAHGGVKADAAFFDARVTTAADAPLPQQPDWAPDPSVTLQAVALRAQAPTAPRPPVITQSPAVDRAPAR